MVVRNVTVNNFIFQFEDPYYNVPGFPLQIVFPGNNVDTTVPSERLIGPKIRTFLDNKLQIGEFQLISESVFDEWVFRSTIGITELDPPGIDRLIPRYLDPLSSGPSTPTPTDIVIENRSLISPEIVAGALTLSQTPTGTVFFMIANGPSPIQNVDFVVSGASVNWATSPLKTANLLQIGNDVTFIYRAV